MNKTAKRLIAIFIPVLILFAVAGYFVVSKGGLDRTAAPITNPLPTMPSTETGAPTSLSEQTEPPQATNQDLNSTTSDTESVGSEPDGTTTSAPTQQPSPTFSFGAAGDYTFNGNAVAVLTRIGRSNLDFHLALGDLGYRKGQEQSWCRLVEDTVGKDLAFQLIAGNHDDGSDGSIANYIKCLPNKMDNITGDYGTKYYFDHKGLVRVIMVSPGIQNFGGSYAAGTDNYNWTKKAIEDAKAQGIEWVVLGMHLNCITPGVKTCQLGEDILNLSIEQDVDLILQGHEHGYYRSKQLTLNQSCEALVRNVYDKDCVARGGSTFKKGAGPILVISGAAGAELRDTTANDSEAAYFETINGRNQGDSYGFSKFTVSKDKMVATFEAAVGSYSDSFVISK